MSHHLVSHLVHVAISLIKVFDERAVKDAVRRQHSVGKHNAWSARSFVVLFKVSLAPLNQATVMLAKER